MTRSRTIVRHVAVVATALAVGAGLMGPADAFSPSGAAWTVSDAPATDGIRISDGEALRYRAKRDPRGDIRRPTRDAAIDLRRIQAWPHASNRPRYAAIRITGYDFPYASNKRNLADVYLNMEGTGRKPDFRVVKLLPRDGDGLQYSRVLKMNGWKNAVGVKRCRELAVRFSSRRDIVTFFVPRVCINAKHGRKFQVHGRLWNITRYSADGQPLRGRFDEVPNRFRAAKPRFVVGWV
jgi:hypothetical protein